MPLDRHAWITCFLSWLGEPSDDIEAWVHEAEDVWYTAGEIVVTYGEPWRCWHVVLSGQLTVLRAGAAGPQFGHLARGAVLGPRGLPPASLAAPPPSDLHAVTETLVRTLVVPLPAMPTPP